MLQVGRVLQVMPRGMMSLVVPMVRVPQVMHRVVALPLVSIVRVLHRVVVRLVCAAGGATGGGEAGSAVARVLQAMQRVMGELQWVLQIVRFGGGAVDHVDGEGAVGDGSGDGDVGDADGEGGCCECCGG